MRQSSGRSNQPASILIKCQHHWRANEIPLMQPEHTFIGHRFAASVQIGHVIRANFPFAAIKVDYFHASLVLDALVATVGLRLVEGPTKCRMTTAMVGADYLARRHINEAFVERVDAFPGRALLRGGRG